MVEIRRIPAPPPNARDRLREALGAILDDPYSDQFEAPQIVERVVREIDEDPEWRRELIAENVAPLVRGMLGNLMAVSRQLGLSTPILLGAQLLGPVEVDRFVERRSSAFDEWLEHAGSKHLRLLDMRKKDLRVARRERVKLGIRYLHVARIHQLLEEQLDNEDQTVGDKFTVEEIARLAATEALPVVNDPNLMHLFADLDGPVLSLPDLPEVKKRGRSR